MKRSSGICNIALVLAILLFGCFVPAAVADDGSGRDVAVYVDFTRFELSSGDEIELSVSLDNRGDVAEDIDLSVAAPEGWEVSLTAWATKTAQVRSVHLEPGQEDPKKLTLKSTVPEATPAGQYALTLTASSRDLVIQRSVDVIVQVTEEGAGYTGPAMVELKPDYTSLQGSPGGDVEFRVDVTNMSAEDKVFDFSTVLPAYVDVTLSPTTDRSKKISALDIAAGETKTIIVKLSMGQDILTEPYTVTFTAASGDVSASVDLNVDVLGHGHLIAQTYRGGEEQGLLSAKATAGKETHVALFVGNDGTGPLENLTFSAPVKPKDWTVTFEPDAVGSLAAKDYKEIDVIIKPKSKAIAGDYYVQIRIRNPGGTAQTLDLRIQVETSSKWLWYAVVIIVAVLAALLGVFLWMRRR